jgi:hypothetical protein
LLDRPINGEAVGQVELCGDQASSGAGERGCIQLGESVGIDVGGQDVMPGRQGGADQVPSETSGGTSD